MDELILRPEEKESLQKLEEVIKKNIQSFYEVGCALMQIRESKLYREEFVTFEEYCKVRWEIARQTAYQLMEASTVIENVRNCGQTKLLPTNEAQARPLTKLPSPELQQEAWKEAIETAPEGKITARHVNKVVTEMIGVEVKKKFKHTKKKIAEEELISEEFQEAFDRFIGAMQNARAKRWKTTSKEVVLKYIEILKNVLLIGE